MQQKTTTQLANQLHHRAQTKDKNNIRSIRVLQVIPCVYLLTRPQCRQPPQPRDVDRPHASDQSGSAGRGRAVSRPPPTPPTHSTTTPTCPPSARCARARCTPTTPITRITTPSPTPNKTSLETAFVEWQRIPAMHCPRVLSIIILNMSTLI